MLLPLIAAAIVGAPADFPYFEAPAGQLYAAVNPNGITVLPNGRFLTPKGRRLWCLGDVWHVLLSPDGQTVVGFHDRGREVGGLEGSLSVFDLRAGRPRRQAVETPALAPAGAFTADGKRLIVSEGDAGSLGVIDVESWKKVATIPLNTDGRKDGYINDIAVTRDGSRAYCVDVATQEVLVVDLIQNRLTKAVPAGREPYALALSADEKSLFVANIGLFNYTAVPLPKEGVGQKGGLEKPPFAFPSKEAEVGVEREGRWIEGLGKTGHPESQSVWRYSLTDPNLPKVTKSAISGVLIHAPAGDGKAVGGSAPNALLLHGNELYVANANNDSISVFRQSDLRLLRTIRIRPVPALARYRGVIPSGMVMNRAGTRLYVCESGLNAVAVIDPKRGVVLGHIPTGWFPMQLSLTGDEMRLVVATQKGLGRGPRGEFHARAADDERFGYGDMPGMLNEIRIPDEKELATWTREVLRNNGLSAKKAPAAANPLPWLPGKASAEIKYVVFITKENHTFDGIFGGDIAGAKSEPRYAEFGMNGWLREKGKTERMPIMPNHIRLAKQYAISDNFYMEPQASGDGHRWLIGVYPSLWTTRQFYAGWSYKAVNHARGRLVGIGSDGSQIPEDYLENGSMWEHLQRFGISFRNYGEGYELPGSTEPMPTSRTGTYYTANHPMPKALWDNTCFEFPAYNNNIPDIARADWFFEDLQKNYFDKGKGLPRFINIAICNDHGAGPQPKLGFPYFSSYLADNDLALGRIVEYLTKRPEWKNMAIFVTQDDPGGDSDHIDRHRSFVLVISPYAKRGYVSKEHTSIMSIIRSIYLAFGLGPSNMFDAVSTGLHDMFTTRPDYTPYTHVPVDPRVFKPEDTLDPTDPKFERRRKMAPTVKMDDPEFMETGRKSGGGGR
jgi:DNA-binding beta-propeller fold protein YncE